MTDHTCKTPQDTGALEKQYEALMKEYKDSGTAGTSGGSIGSAGVFPTYPAPCPSCGHCPTCGRRNSYPVLPYYQPYVTYNQCGGGGEPAYTPLGHSARPQ